MNNKELETKVLEIIAEKNFFDAVEKAYAFKKDYEKTDFYKATKISILDLIKNARDFYLFNMDTIFGTIQKKINTLDLSNFNKIIEDIGNMFEKENEAIRAEAESFNLESFLKQEVNYNEEN